MSKEIYKLTRRELKAKEKWEQVGPNQEYVVLVREALCQYVFGQEEPMEALAKAMTRAGSGLADPYRPAFVGLFLGPTGVGKSESARALARFVGGTRFHLLRVDCGELSEKHTIHRFTGAPPSYVGYGDELLVKPDFLKKPNVILLDEIEKAHPEIHRMLLSVFENGSLTATIGEGHSWRARQVKLDFANSYIIMTSNVGAREIQDIVNGNIVGFIKPSFSPKEQVEQIEKAGRANLKKEFHHMPEFLNRIDEVVVFKPLEKKHYYKILNKFLKEYSERQRFGNNPLFLTRYAKTHVVNEAWKNKHWGGREIRRIFEQDFLTRLSEVMLSGAIKERAPVVGDWENNEWVFYTTEPPEEIKASLSDIYEKTPIKEENG